ncbi:MAG: hypothetical protein LC808_10680 [Actinobacteria bacterium]|nr:hypothetical protein [Actinomycetota bacterium]
MSGQPARWLEVDLQVGQRLHVRRKAEIGQTGDRSSGFLGFQPVPQLDAGPEVCYPHIDRDRVFAPAAGHGWSILDGARLTRALSRRSALTMRLYGLGRPRWRPEDVIRSKPKSAA